MTWWTTLHYRRRRIIFSEDFLYAKPKGFNGIELESNWHSLPHSTVNYLSYFNTDRTQRSYILVISNNWFVFKMSHPQAYQLINGWKMKDSPVLRSISIFATFSKNRKMKSHSWNELSDNPERKRYQKFLLMISTKRKVSLHIKWFKK